MVFVSEESDRGRRARVYACDIRANKRKAGGNNVKSNIGRDSERVERSMRIRWRCRWEPQALKRTMDVMMANGMVLNRGDGRPLSGFSFGQRCWSHWVSKAGLIIQDGEEEESEDMKTAMRRLTCVNLGEAKDAASLPLFVQSPNTTHSQRAQLTRFDPVGL